MSFLTKIFGSSNQRSLKRMQIIVDKINDLESEYQQSSDEELSSLREKFKTFLSEFNFLQPENRIAQTAEEAKIAVDELGYPVIVRPSYVLGGRAMELIYTDQDLRNYLTNNLRN